MRKKDGILFNQTDRDQLEDFVLRYGIREVVYKLSQIEEDLGMGPTSELIVKRLRSLWKVLGQEELTHA